MAHWTKSFKRYERHFLLGLVILLLASFSVTGALARCRGGAPVERSGLGGSFSVVGQAERVTKTDAEMMKAMQRFSQYANTVQGPTLDFSSYLRRARPAPAQKNVWMHTVLAEAARLSGYRCGPAQLARAVKVALGSNERTSSLEVTPETYERFITQIWGRPAREFEDTLREVVVKDELLSCLVDPMRFDQTYAQAYEEWKSSRERVDLHFLAAEAEGFAEDARAEEQTRRELSKAEDALRQAADTARRIKRVLGSLKDYKGAKGALPESLALLAAKDMQTQTWALGEAQIKDAWDHALVYVGGAGEPSVVSNGPDGQPGTDDDVTAALEAQLDSHRALGRVAEALVRWRTAGDPKVWPATLADLLKPPAHAAAAGATLPPLNALPKDGWDHDLLYTTATPEAAPMLTSAGPDGQPGTADDIAAEVGPERGSVAPGGALARYVPSGLKDSWGRAIGLRLRVAEQGVWEARSDGKDGQPGTADDVLGGNSAELEGYYAQPSVRATFVQPMRRRFKALIMHLPLISEATLKRLWADYPELRPGAADEERLFLRWQSGRGSSEAYEFNASDPRDPEKGHGVALAKRLGWPKEALLLVPSKSLFEVPPAPPLAPAAPPAPGAAPAPPAAPAAPDPLRVEYDTKGWREILFRQEFLENVLNHHWKDVVASRQAIKDWERAGNKVTPRPPEIALEDLLSEARLGKYQPSEAERAQGYRFLEFYSTDKADKTPVLLSSVEIEQLKEFGDASLPIHLGQLKGQDVSSVPIQLNTRLTKVVAQNLDLQAERTPELSEVADKVFEKFVEHKRMQRAERELAAFQRDVQTRTAERKEGDSDEAIWSAALAAWKAAHPGVTVHDERTGLFIGVRVPATSRPSEGASASERQALARRNFVRQGGYGLVRAGEAKQDTTDSKPGTFGRTLLRDESTGEGATGCAYLVRVAERVYPSEYEFSPRAYAEHQAARVFGDRREQPGGQRGMPVGFRKGTMNGQVAMYLEEIERLQPLFDLRTNSNLDTPGGNR